MSKIKFNKRKIIRITISLAVFITIINLKVIRIKRDESPNKEFAIIEYVSIKILLVPEPLHIFKSNTGNELLFASGYFILYDNVEKKEIHKFQFEGCPVITTWSNDTLFYYYKSLHIDADYIFKLPRSAE